MDEKIIMINIRRSVFFVSHWLETYTNYFRYSLVPTLFVAETVIRRGYF